MPRPLNIYRNAFPELDFANDNWSCFCHLCNDYLLLFAEGQHVTKIVCKCLPQTLDAWVMKHQPAPPTPPKPDARDPPSPRPADIATRKPVGFTAAELLAMDLPPAKWAIPGYICAGLNILAGGQKLGKSWMAYDTAIAVASGGRAFGAIEVEQGDVLYLALEDTKRRLQDRLIKLLHGEPAPDRLWLFTEWPQPGEGGLMWMRQWLDEHPDARLIIIDTLKKFRPPRRGNGNAYDEDYDFMGLLKSLADEYEVAVVVLHHVRKMAADDIFDMVSGTIGITGAADATLILERQRGRNDALLHVTGRDVEEKAADDAMALEWNPNTGSWTLMGSAVEHNQSDGRREVCELLDREMKQLSSKEIAALLDRNYSTIRALLRKMVCDNQIRGGDGKYWSKKLDLLITSDPRNTRNTRNTSHENDDLGGNSLNDTDEEEGERGEWWR